MAELQTPVVDTPVAPAPQKKPHEKKKRNKKLVKNAIIATIVIAALAAGGFLVWKFVFAPPKEGGGELLTDTAMPGSIASMVEGSGSAIAKDSATITLAAAGTVQEVFIAEGQQVAKGDPLYVITSAAAELALSNAKESLQKQQEAMATLNKEMADLQKSRNDLTITAPHGGKLTDCATVLVGDQVSSGTKIAVLVDDTKLKLSLYYSYAYENDIQVGQTADISVPATMSTLRGTVETINKVERIVPEGGKTFEVIFVVDNPGTMTEGMAASAALKTAGGAAIYPYEGGSFKYYKTTTISAKADGPAEQVKGLMNYANMKAGQVLVVQGTRNVDEKITAKREQITTAQKSLEEAVKKVETEQKNLENFSAVAPMGGTIISCALATGAEVESGKVAVTIADTTVMTVNISVDERNFSYIKSGMMIDLNDWGGNSFMGIVESVGLVPKSENGVTTYPVIVKVDNPEGTLVNGMGLNYRFTAAQAEGIIVIPVPDVRYISLEGSTTPTSVVFLQADTAPENAIDVKTLPAEVQAQVPAGFFVVPVVTGLSDETNVEIKEGLKDGDVVFNNISKNSANGDNFGNGGGGGAVMVG
ncbi:MAG: efflux RND transporter periplasmic adaptor subunit [Pseudoflavonifractor sp.]